jgi:hypothetical protein
MEALAMLLEVMEPFSDRDSGRSRLERVKRCFRGLLWVSGDCDDCYYVFPRSIMPKNTIS